MTTLLTAVFLLAAFFPQSNLIHNPPLGFDALSALGKPDKSAVIYFDAPTRPYDALIRR